jgi:uncharacterized membrane protein
MNSTSIHLLEIAAIVTTGILAGCEFAVAVFFHPSISRLPDTVHIQAAQALAKILGRVMSFWYPVSVLLTFAATFVVHTIQSQPWWLALSSAVLLALICIYSLLLPVPINNQVARWRTDTVPANWRDLRRRWDLFHAIRVVF